MAKLFLSGITHPIAFELEQGFNTVGRNPTNDLRIRDATVSSFHCELELKQEIVLVRDLGSSNGTFVDGRQVEESRLETGSILQLGSVKLRLEQRTGYEPPNIVIPNLPRESIPAPVTLADGCPACSAHPSTHAAYQCSRCGKPFCSGCVRTLSLIGGQTREFCPSCSGECQPLQVPVGVSTVPPKKSSSILGRLSQTIRIRHK